MSPEFLGNRSSPTPQRIEEEIHSDIDSMILEVPLEIAIEHLQTYLRNRQHEKLRLTRGFSYGNRQASIVLKGQRSETETEVSERLVSSRDSIHRDVQRSEEKYREAKEALEKAEKALQTQKEKLLNFDNTYQV